MKGSEADSNSCTFKKESAIRCELANQLNTGLSAMISLGPSFIVNLKKGKLYGHVVIMKSDMSIMQY